MENEDNQQDITPESQNTHEVESGRERIEGILNRAQSSVDLFSGLYRNRGNKSLDEVVKETNELAPEVAKSPIVIEGGLLVGTSDATECLECGEHYNRYRAYTPVLNPEYGRDFEKQPVGDYDVDDTWSEDYAANSIASIDGAILYSMREKLNLRDMPLMASGTYIGASEWHALTVGGHEKTAPTESILLDAVAKAEALVADSDRTPEEYDRLFHESREKELSYPSTKLLLKPQE